MTEPLISSPQIKIYLHMMNVKGWADAREVERGTGLTIRSVRFNLDKLFHLGVLDRAAVSPGHRFRIADNLSRNAVTYIKKMEAMRDVFGL